MRVVLVPGFTQTADSWRDVRDVVREVAEVRACNVPLRDSFRETAGAIGEEGGRAIYVGYSMGGRLCLQLALDHPELVAGLVLVSATAGLARAHERADRVRADEKLAREIERDGVDAFVKWWLDQPLFATVPPDAPGLAQRASLPAAYLTGCLRVLGTGAMPSLWHRLGELRMPVALVTGRDDAKFDRLAGTMLERMRTDVQHVRIEGGHAVPLEHPEVLGGFIVAFVSQHSDS